MATGATSSALLGQGIYSGGYNAARGYRRVGAHVEGLVKPGVDVGDIEWALPPSRETLFRVEGIDSYLSPYTEKGEKTHREIIFNVLNCDESVSSSQQRQDNFMYAAMKNASRGYKTRDLTPGNLNTNQNAPSNYDGDTDVPEPIHTEETEDADIDPKVVNEEYVTFKNGYRYTAPNQGRDLPGPLSVALKGSNIGPAMWTTKRYGYQISGRYAGYQSAKANASGLVYTGYQ